jgi:hypothetical protein
VCEDSSLFQERRRVLPKRDMVRIPAPVSAIVQFENRVRGGGGEALTLLPGNELVVAAVDHEQRAGVVGHRVEAVEVVAE